MPWRSALKIDTDQHKEPDTRLTKSDIGNILEQLDDADRTEILSILHTIREKLINTYFEKELDTLEGELKSQKEMTLVRIRSVIKGLLDKMTLIPQSGGAKKGHNFQFHSVQVHAVLTNGRRKTRKNIVSVKGSKGQKKVEIYDSSKKRKTFKNSKRLTAAEIANIRRGKFMPGLFKGL